MVSTPPINHLIGRATVFVFLGLAAMGLVAGLFALFQTLATDSADAVVSPRHISEAELMLLTAGIGSLIYAIRAFLLHACDKRDFSLHFVPWYVFWVVLGSLVGLIVYFGLRGGVLLLTMGDAGTPIEFNIWSLGAIGALSGLFSKYAIEKLREVFLVAFSMTDKGQTKPAP